VTILWSSQKVPEKNLTERSLFPLRINWIYKIQV
jgi:hypothetical protein